MKTFSLAMVALIAFFCGSASAQNVIAWGNSSHGQTNVPPSATNVVAVACGWYHSMVLRQDGNIVTWGTAPAAPPEATNIISIAAAATYSLALRNDGKVLAWGTNSYGVLSTIHLASLTNIIAISAGNYHALALRSNGTVYAWGHTSYGATTVPSSVSNVVAIAAGANQSIVLRADGTVLLWGNTSESGTPPFYDPVPFIPVTVNNKTPVLGIFAGLTNNMVLGGNGRLIEWNTRKVLRTPTAATNIVQASAGSICHLALRSDGRVIAWGSGAATNIPSFATNVVAIAVGISNALAITSDGSPRIFGPPGYQQHALVAGSLPLRARVSGSSPLHFQWFADGLAIPGATNSAVTNLAMLGTDNVAYHFVVSNSLGCATSTVSKIRVLPVSAWGDTIHGEQRIPLSFTNAVALAAGAGHILGLQENGTVVAWGKNTSGQATVPLSATNISAIAVGNNHSLALRTNGTVVAWGHNWDGQTNVPPSVTNVIGIAAGWAHSIALRADGTVIAWGNNEMGQTNVPSYLNNVIAIAAGYYHNLALKTDGTVVAWANGEENGVPLSATNIVAIAAGWSQSLALRADGVLIAWGETYRWEDTYSQNVAPSWATNIAAISAGWYHNSVLRSDGTVAVWGKNNYGITNVPHTLGNVTTVVAGENFNVALVDNGAPVIRSLRAPATQVGARTLLTAVVGGAQPLVCQWFHEGVAIAGATNRFLIITNVAQGDAGSYTLVVSNGAGQTSRAADLTIPSLPYLANISTKQQILPWVPFRLSPVIYGPGPFNYQWRCNGTNLVDGGRISGATDSVLEINTAEFSDSGNYELVVGNASGSITGLVSQITVTPILVWGDNSAGQSDVPLEAKYVTAISTEGDHCLALTEDGKVIAWGDNTYGQNNVPADATNIARIYDGVSHCLAVKSNGTVIAWGDNTYHQCDVLAAATNVLSAALGRYFTGVLREDGTIVAWGSFTAPSLTNVIAIDAEYEDSSYLLALTGDGKLRNTWNTVLASNLVAFDFSLRRNLGLRTDGKVIDLYYYSEVPAFVTNVVSISAGIDHGLGLRADGTVLAWGENYGGQIIVPPMVRNIVDIDAGYTHSMALAQVSPVLNIATQPAGQTVQIGDAAELTVFATGQGPLRYQWSKNGVEIPGATNATHVIEGVRITDLGTYTVEVNNLNDSTHSIEAILSLDPAIPLFTAATASNDGLVLTWNSLVGRTYQLQFKPDLNAIAWSDIETRVAADSSISMTNSMAGNTGYYRVILLP